jgi:3-methyladenine DNA glycosylase/8-oxoguanine DNA glycosylase
MTDEPENLTLKLLREIRAEQERLAGIVGKIADAVTAIATTQGHHGQVLERHSAILESMDERLQIAEGRLNTIDGRLARIEKHTGLVKA